MHDETKQLDVEDHSSPSDRLMDRQREFHDRLSERWQQGSPFVIVTVVDCHGSVPTEVGSKMVVDSQGLCFGTVGGGRLEHQAIEVSLALLQPSDPDAMHGPLTQFVDWSLKADVGMTCGGRVKLFFERCHSSSWSIVIFGAGHVTQSLARLLSTLNCRVTCIDPREDWLAKLPTPVHRVVAPDPVQQVAKLTPQDFVLCMTKGHHSDLPILRAIFDQRRRLPFLGVIGSQAKAAVLRKELVASGLDPAELAFHCPVGLVVGDSPLGNNDPGEIAVSIVAQLLVMRDAWLQKGRS